MHNQKPLTLDEQLELAAITQRSWIEDGYITPAGVPNANSTPDDEHGGCETNTILSPAKDKQGDFGTRNRRLEIWIRAKL